ncbi:MAG: MFS transporter [Spirosomataceae bacterium]
MNYLKVKISLFINYFVFALLLNSVGTVILQVQRTYGVSESAASVLEAFKDLSIAGISFLVASFLTRIGYKKAMLVGLSATAAICLVMPSLDSFWGTKLLFLVIGLSFGLIKVSVFSTMGLVTSDQKEHISLMSFIESFFMIGILSGYFIFTAFIDESNPSAWLRVYYWLAGLCVLAFVLLWSTPLDESAVKPEESRPMVEEFAEMFRLIILPLVMVFVGCVFFYVLIEQSIMSWLPTFNNKVLKLPATLSIQMASILAISTAVGRFLSGILVQRINWLYLLLGCLLLAGGLVLITIPLAQQASGATITGWTDAPLAAFVFPIIGLLIAPIYPTINSLILSKLPVRQHGTMSGLIVVFSALGGTTGSIITGHIFEAYGGETAFYFSLVPMTLLMVLLFFYRKLQGGDSKVTITATGGH